LTDRYFIACFSIFPIPIYVDLAKGRIIALSAHDSLLPLPPGSFPLPFAFFALVFVLIPALFIARRQRSIIKIEFSKSYVLALASIIPLILVTIYMSGALVKLVQLYFPLLIILFIPKIKDMHSAEKIRYWVLSVLTLIISIHLLSIMNSDPNDPYRYASFIDMSIYSSMVSWPAVLCLYFFFVVFWPRHRGGSVLDVLFRVLLSLLIFVDILLSYRRESLLIFLVIFSLILVGVFCRSLLQRKMAVVNIDMWFIVSILILAALMIMSIVMGLPIAGRLENLFTDSDRMSMWRNSINLSLNPIFFGTLNPVNNLHSLVVSLFVSFGLFGLLPYILVVKRVLNKWFPIVSLSGFLRRSSSEILLLNLQMSMLVIFILSNIINVSGTQPFFMCNFFLIMILSEVAYRDFRSRQTQSDLVKLLRV